MIRSITRKRCARVAALALVSCAVVPGAALAARNLDARDELVTRAPRVAPGAAQLDAVSALEASMPALAVRYDHTTGATRSLTNRGGYLSAASGADAEAIARGFVGAQAAALGLAAADVADLEVTDRVPSRLTGVTHVYLRQRHAGLPVYNGALHVAVNRDGRVLSVTSTAMPALASATAASRAGTPSAASAAIAAAGAQIGESLDASAIGAELMWLPITAGNARLVWNFQVETADGQHHYDFTVDALDGKVWTRIDWTQDADYRVFERPVESPNHAGVTPPADGRTVLTDPHDPTASPLGWHDTGSTAYTILRGNNVHAYDDLDGNNQPPASQPDCGVLLECDFDAGIDFSVDDPNDYVAAAVANLFYWNNIVHDTQYLYGFDEPAGNFQVSNFGNGGNGGDDVRAEAQDGNCGAFSCNNANFSTPPDGSRPRMQMYLWDTTNPRRDGDFDNGIIVHEYGHGISIRQTGGPSNSSCLGGQHQPGEGWSDWWSLAYTVEPGDQGTDKRGIGTYALGEPTSGDGIRPQAYSTSPAINSYTYESMNGSISVPHGVGSVWAQAIWEVYWALVDEHGFDPDLTDPSPWAGNHRAMAYVNEGLKSIPCSPSFVDTRDGVILAAQELQSTLGGDDVCLLWETFAAFGLGTDADPGPSTSVRQVSNGFGVPPFCDGGGCVDADADGYGAFGAPSCPMGTVRDCDDSDPAVNPGATEIPRNGTDDDCDPLTPTNGCEQIAEVPSLVEEGVGSGASGLILLVAPVAALALARRRRR